MNVSFLQFWPRIISILLSTAKAKWVASTPSSVSSASRHYVLGTYRQVKILYAPGNAPQLLNHGRKHSHSCKTVTARNRSHKSNQNHSRSHRTSIAGATATATTTGMAIGQTTIIATTVATAARPHGQQSQPHQRPWPQPQLHTSYRRFAASVLACELSTSPCLSI